MKIKKADNKINSNLKVFAGLSIDLQTLDILCRYILSDSSLLRMSHISNLNQLLKSLDKSTYENDPDKYKRVQFLAKAIDARLNYNLKDVNLIINHIRTGLNFDIDFIDLNNINLSLDEITWINTNIIESTSKYGFLYNYADQFLDICTKIKTSDYAHRGNVISEFEHTIDMVKNDFRKVTIDDNPMNLEFSLMPGQFENTIAVVYQDAINQSKRLMTGMQGLNKMLNGGFEDGRVYVLFGITGVGKSITLLNIAIQIKKYNTNYKTKDPSKRPAIIYFTMENTVKETIMRIFSMICPNQQMPEMKLDEVINKLKNDGELTISDQSPIDIIIKYKANRSVDTSYLYTLYDDYNDIGIEPICIIQDHLMRIRSVERNPETRFELGDIVNEFKVFAAEKDIPVITNFHLNREAMKSVEHYANKASSIDVTQKLGKSNVSESVLVLNNSDCSIVINKEYDSANNIYMGFNIIKMREKVNLGYFAQPFMYNNESKLVEDVGGPAMYKESIHGNPDTPRIENVKTSSSNALNSIGQIADLNQKIDTGFLNDRYSFSDDGFSYDFEDGNSFDNIEQKEDDDYLLIKKPAIINPLIIMDPPPVEQSLTLESLNELKELTKNKVSPTKVLIDLNSGDLTNGI